MVPAPTHTSSSPISNNRIDLLKIFSPVLLTILTLSQTDFVTTAELSPEYVLGGFSQVCSIAGYCNDYNWVT